MTKAELTKLEERVQKEHGDVVRTMNSIDTTMKGVMDKKDKLSKTTDPKRKKLYAKQIKDSGKYLDSLFTSLRLEMWEYNEADFECERAVVTEGDTDGQSDND